MVKAGPCSSALYNERCEPRPTSAALGCGAGTSYLSLGGRVPPSSSLPGLEILS